VIDSLKAGHQAMVFVHSRKDTGKTGRTIIQKAQNSSDTAIFDVTEHPQWAFVSRDVKKSRNKCVTQPILMSWPLHRKLSATGGSIWPACFSTPSCSQSMPQRPLKHHTIEW
jgi:hypothetical protein